MAPSDRAVELAKKTLAKIAAYDPHFPNPNKGQLMAWAEHISLKNPSEDDMMAAVTKFYETNQDAKPLPAAITALARGIRQDRMARRDYQPPPNKAADPEPEQPAGAKKITMAEWEKAHGVEFPKFTLGHDLDGPSPLKVRCPWCKQSEGSRCVVPGTATQLKAFHDARVAVVENRCGGVHHVYPHTDKCPHWV